jgi:nucleotide-binding universal stress UspA family protein
MFRSLLVPLDGTKFGEQALPLAEGIARTTGASIHLAHVHVPHPPDGLISNTQFQYEGLDLGEYDDHTRSDEHHYLSELVQRVAGEADVDVDASLLEADGTGRTESRVAHPLQDHARATGADVVILATHGRSGLPRAWHGSVAEELIQCTTLPVLAIHAVLDRESGGSPTALRRLLVPLDGSRISEAILPPAEDLARSMGATLILLRAIRTAHPIHESEGEVAQYLERHSAQLEDRGIEVQTVVERGVPPAEAICAVAKETGADLIALATHGRSGLRRAVLGSVTLRVLHETDLPVLVRRPAEA